MKKKSFLDKIAEKAFASPKFQQSWAVHEKAFGPILTPAFVDDMPARVELTDALNRISRGEIAGALKKLQKVEKACRNDADRAAWLFFMGLALEMAGDRQNMLSFYTEACEYDHRFYLPYMKLAKSAHADAVFEVAEENYRKAIACFDESDADAQNRALLASAWTNLASCLTMMHHPEEAAAALEKSAQIQPQQPGRESALAILAAARGEAENAEKWLDALERSQSPLFEGAQKLVGEILAGENAHFCLVPSASERIGPFWQWFAAEEARMIGMFEQKQYDGILAMLTEQLQPMFPFMERDLEFGILFGDGIYEVDLGDFFSVSLREGYRKLLAACPEELKARWKFEIVH